MLAGRAGVNLPEVEYTEEMRRKEEAEMQNRVDNLIFQAESVMKKLNKDDKRRMTDLVKEAKKALKSKDPVAVRNSCMDLERVLNAAGQSVWNTDATASSEDGVYDASYEPVDSEKP